MASRIELMNARTRIEARKKKLEQKLAQINGEIANHDKQYEKSKHAAHLWDEVNAMFELEIKQTELIVAALESCEFKPYRLDEAAQIVAEVLGHDRVFYNHTPTGSFHLYSPVVLTGDRALDVFLLKKHVANVQYIQYTGALITLDDNLINVSFYEQIDNANE